jgi:hypothetical protein
MDKVKIHAFRNRDFSDNVGVLTLPVNPESYSKNYKVEYDTRVPHGSHGTSGRFNATAPEQLRLEFFFDGTNTIQGYEYDGIAKNRTEKEATITNKEVPNEDLVSLQLERFLNTVYDMSGETHRPHFLKIVWGERLFQGILSNLDINYSLFHPNGKPLRVKISATFLDYIAQEQRQQRANLHSPDLTRIRRIKGGDRLDKMVNEFYNDPKFITQIARVNSLTTFRSLKPGIELAFPPLDKTEDA